MPSRSLTRTFWLHLITVTGKGLPGYGSMVFNVPGQKWHHRCHWAPGCALQVGLFCESPAATQWNSVGILNRKYGPSRCRHEFVVSAKWKTDPDISVWLLNHQLRQLHKRSTSFMHSMCIFWGLKRWSKQLMMTIAAQLQVESLTGYTRKSIYAVPKHEFHQFPKLRSLLWTTAKPQVVSASMESSCGKSLRFDSIGHWTAWCCFYMQNLPCTKWTWCCFCWPL